MSLRSWLEELQSNSDYIIEAAKCKEMEEMLESCKQVEKWNDYINMLAEPELSTTT